MPKPNTTFRRLREQEWKVSRVEAAQKIIAKYPPGRQASAGFYLRGSAGAPEPMVTGVVPAALVP